MSEKFLKHTEGQCMRSTSVSLCKDVYSHKVHKHISSRWDACICAATAQSKKQKLIAGTEYLSILNTPPVSQSPMIQFEPWGQVSQMHPARWEGIILTCSVRLSGRTWALQSPSMAHVGAQTEHCNREPTAPCWPFIFSSPEHKGGV